MAGRIRVAGLAAGDRVDYQVTWLELDSGQIRPRVPKPEGEEVTFVEAIGFPQWLFFALYDAVGKDYAWDDMHEVDPEQADALLDSPDTRLFTMVRSGWPQGFYLLDLRTPTLCDIAYFGLVEQAIGRGLGGRLLDDAVSRGWSFPGVSRITVNTCTLDHPAAMQLYVSRGFKPVRSETRSRVLKRALKFPRH